MIKITYSIIDDANHDRILVEKSKELSNFENCTATLSLILHGMMNEANSELRQQRKYLI